MKKLFLIMLFISTLALSAQALSFNVSSGTLSQNTGFNVTAGQMLNITSDFWDTWSAGTNPRTSNADGLDGNPLIPGNHNYGFYGSFRYGAMVGHIGSNPYFLVGTNYHQIATHTGDLFLGYWDSYYTDNTGSIKANITTGAPLPGVAAAMLFGGFTSLAGLIRRKKQS